MESAKNLQKGRTTGYFWGQRRKHDFGSAPNKSLERELFDYVRQRPFNIAFDDFLP